jgi:hypothetical protein
VDAARYLAAFGGNELIYILKAEKIQCVMRIDSIKCKKRRKERKDKEKQKKTANECRANRRSDCPKYFEMLQDDVAFAIVFACSSTRCCCSGVRFLM